MKDIIKVIKEQIDNFYLIARLSIYEIKSANFNNYLGVTWELINPLIQIVIYWFVFGYGIRQREPLTLQNGIEMPFIYWMLSGIILWFFFYQSTIQGSKSIYTRIQMLSKMNFPMSVIPNIVIFSQLYIHAALLIITMIILNLVGHFISIYYTQIVYFLFSTIVFTYAISLITSTLSTMVRDIHMFLNATLRMLLYLSPILWDINGINNEAIQLIMKLNPLYYLIEGYRAALFGTSWYLVEHWHYSIYFWGLTLLLLIIGSKLHLKFRRHFIDFV